MNKDKNERTDDETSEEGNIMNAIAKNSRPCTITESIIQSCKEIKLMQEGKLPKRNWDDFAKKMRETIKEDEE